MFMGGANFGNELRGGGKEYSFAGGQATTFNVQEHKEAASVPRELCSQDGNLVQSRLF